LNAGRKLIAPLTFALPQPASSKQAIPSDRTAQAQKPVWGIAVETETNMEIDLLHRVRR
jgi:hypothetical protein